MCDVASCGGVGSSPLARGLHLYDQVVRSNDRIIPARAGFTTPAPTTPGSPPDHPRSRGVYEDLPLDTIIEWGSSPLARGLRK